jgi:hypothetical protein
MPHLRALGKKSGPGKRRKIANLNRMTQIGARGAVVRIMPSATCEEMARAKRSAQVLGKRREIVLEEKE